MGNKVIFNWSGGKDSAMALHKLLQAPDYEIMCLLTSISEPYQRISMHGVRTALLETQAQHIGLPLVKMEIPEMPSMEDYERVMRETMDQLVDQGADYAAFGDIFLEDLRAYREQKLEQIGLKALFPLWKQPTDKLIRDFIDMGFKTIVTCVNEQYLDKSFAGRVIDHDFLKDLPANVDPCGENGEFHTFVFEGPIFRQPVAFTKGEVVYRKYGPAKEEDNISKDNEQDPYAYGFWYCDLLPE
jgi:uncharacterized protein (TIGR00290 family)